MIEIVVSMLLLSLLAIAFLPMLVTSLRVSVANNSISTATQLVATQMEGIRAIPSPTCAQVTSYADVLNRPQPFNQQGRVLQAFIAADPCPTTASGLVSVRVWVEDSTNDTLSEATTLVLVKG